MALELLVSALWLVVAGMGAWLLVTGRDLFFWMPPGFTDARIRRLFGLVYVLMATFFIDRESLGSNSVWAVTGLYAGLGLSYGRVWWTSRGARA